MKFERLSAGPSPKKEAKMTLKEIIVLKRKIQAQREEIRLGK